MSTYLPRLLITGGSGQVASALVAQANTNQYHLIVCSRAELDISDRASIQRAFLQHQPDMVINTAAYTKVDQAEVEQELAMQANYQGAKELAITCQQHQIPLIHLSTDYIFDGEETIPYTENYPAHPIQIYGHSKWLGEEAIRQYCEQFIILRVCGIFSEYGHNFVKSMLRLLQEKTSLRVVADQFTCPTYAGDIAQAIFNLLPKFRQADTIHFCNQPALSWHQFTLAILEEAKIHMPQISWIAEDAITAIKTAEYPTLAKRPLYSVFDCKKIEYIYGIKLTHWQEGLRKTFKSQSS